MNPAREAFADLRDPGSVRTARIAWPVTSAHLHLAAATDRIGSRFTLHNVVSSADHVLATHRRSAGARHLGRGYPCMLGNKRGSKWLNLVY